MKNILCQLWLGLFPPPTHTHTFGSYKNVIMKYCQETSGAKVPCPSSLLSLGASSAPNHWVLPSGYIMLLQKNSEVLFTVISLFDTNRLCIGKPCPPSRVSCPWGTLFCYPISYFSQALGKHKFSSRTSALASKYFFLFLPLRNWLVQSSFWTEIQLFSS